MTEQQTVGLRPELEALPYRIAQLPIHRGYPVPWFVSWENGVPEFRVADGDKWLKAIQEKLCWVCGDKLGRFLTFVLGPMCGINRTTTEPPCHIECAGWSARNCPFLSKPQMTRRENDIPDGTEDCIGGVAIKRNPGVTLLWTTRSYNLFDDGRGRPLIEIGEPTAILWYALGRPARREQVAASVDSGLPILMKMAEKQEGDTADLLRRKAWLEARYPKELP